MYHMGQRPAVGRQWDEEMQVVYVEIKQSKISKAKLIAFVAGADRRPCMCAYLSASNWWIPHRHTTPIGTYRENGNVIVFSNETVAGCGRG